MAQTAEGNRLTANERERLHGGKRRFTCEKDAIRWVVTQRQAGRRTGSGRVYLCPVCVGWHAGPGIPVMVGPLAANG